MGTQNHRPAWSGRLSGQPTRRLASTGWRIRLAWNCLLGLSALRIVWILTSASVVRHLRHFFAGAADDIRRIRIAWDFVPCSSIVLVAVISVVSRILPPRDVIGHREPLLRQSKRRTPQ
jgi:hypothetical protein